MKHRVNLWNLLIGAIVVMALVVAFLRWTHPEKTAEETAPADKSVPADKTTKPARRTMADVARGIAERAKEREAERLANWKANFPFKPTYHPTFKYDPTIYEVGNPETYSNESSGDLGDIVMSHSLLADFFESDLRYSAQFEHMYHILEEYDRHDNPLALAKIFQNLRDYHEASSYPFGSLWHREVYYTEDAKVNEETLRMEWNPRWEPVDGKKTWGEVADDCAESICYNLHAREEWPGREQLSTNVVEAIRDRLILEIHGVGKLRGSAFAYSQTHMEALEAGDPLLIPYEGWLEDYRQWQREYDGWIPPEERLSQEEQDRLEFAEFEDLPPVQLTEEIIQEIMRDFPSEEELREMHRNYQSRHLSTEEYQQMRAEAEALWREEMEKQNNQ